MRVTLNKSALLCAGLVLGAVAPAARGAYVLTPVSSGTSNSSVSVAPGGTFAVDFVLSSNASDVHNAIIFRPTFSSAGLMLQSYLWAGGYSTGTIDDNSTPNVVDKGGGRPQTPTAIDAITFNVTPGVVDVEMTNVLSSGTFGVGNLVTLTFQVPLTWSGPSTVTINSSPFNTGNGFTQIPTTAGTPLTVNIIPEPTALGFFGVAVAGLVAGRRRRR